ncbi:MAG: hypothetical protein ACR2KX_02080 [Chitinophagaceae bacterium]
MIDKLNKMVEVFKTNMNDKDHADKFLKEFHKENLYYQANFDLQDCDKIFRVESENEILANDVISIFKEFGFKAEILNDN